VRVDSRSVGLGIRCPVPAPVRFGGLFYLFFRLSAHRIHPDNFCRDLFFFLCHLVLCEVLRLLGTSGNSMTLKKSPDSLVGIWRHVLASF